MSTATATPGPIETSIHQKLTSALRPVSLQISNDSWQHRHHLAMKDVEDTAETHFSLQIVSEMFEGKTTMQRHRLVYSALASELEQGLHSLSLKTKTPAEVEKLVTVQS